MKVNIKSFTYIVNLSDIHSIDSIQRFAKQTHIFATRAHTISKQIVLVNNEWKK